MGSGGSHGQEIVGPDRYWKRAAFCGRYCRHFIDALSQYDYFVRYHFQCMMAIAQGIQHIAEKPDRILDAGCGHGMRAVEMQTKYFPSSVVLGCDYSEHMIQQANLIISNLPATQRVRCEQQDVRDLPYQDDTFDAVYSYGLLMSLDEPEKGIAELMRVSRHGLVAIEETPQVMDSIQLRYWTEYNEKRFPGRTYWHDYLKLLSPYGTVIFNRIPTDVWEPSADVPENHKVPPAYARLIVSK